MRQKPIVILSLGAGVQSSCLLLMSCRGELPKLDAAIFADTHWESKEVYTHLEWLKVEAKTAGIPLHVVSGGDLRQHSVEGFIGGGSNGRYATMPLHTLMPNGDRAMVRRQCTREYKVEPITRFIKMELLHLSRRARWPKEVVIHQWFGISADELRRVRTPNNLWCQNTYPLINLPDPMLPYTMTRQGCIEWFRKHYPTRHIPRSACIGCPFHSDKSWRYIRDNHPDEWADAVEVDGIIRHADRMKAQAFLHSQCVPLDEADIDSDQQKGQGVFAGFKDECLGYCGQ